jgi:hypothetical protein
VNAAASTLASLATSVLLVACGSADRGEAPRPHVASASCPLKTPSDWQHFLEAAVEDETWVTTCSDHGNCAELVGAFSARLEKSLLDVLALCESDVADNPPIASCTANLRRFVPAWLRQHAPDSYGFRPDNGSYLAAQTGPDVPGGMMNPPEAYLAALPERAALEEAARTNGWPYLTHDSGLGGVRTFVTVADPARRFDQWMVVGLDPTASFVPTPAIMSFISVQKKDRAGNDLEKVRIHFRDYVVSNTEGAFKLELPETFAGKCYACHTSGMRLLIPTRESVAASAPVRGEAGYGVAGVDPDFGLERLSSLNQRLLSYGLPDWNGTIDAADHGPPLGKTLGCTECHNGANRGVLTVSTSEGMLRQKVVDQLSMRAPGIDKSVPDEPAMALLVREKTGDPPLSATEQAALARARSEHWADYQAIVAERFPAWKAWVLDERCE